MFESKTEYSQRDDRIGSKCWYQTPYLEGKRPEWRRGTLRQWSLDSLRGESGSFGAAIVEDDESMRCWLVEVVCVCFASEKPSD